VEFDIAKYLPRIKASGKKYGISRLFLIASNGVKLDAETLMDESLGDGEAGKSQAVDLVFVGSESGQLELRHPPIFPSPL
jgi:hypothetical protein